MLDPYAGTGSVLVAAAAFGAQVMGADIDVRVRAGVAVKGGRSWEGQFLGLLLHAPLTKPCQHTHFLPGLHQLPASVNAPKGRDLLLSEPSALQAPLPCLPPTGDQAGQDGLTGPAARRLHQLPTVRPHAEAGWPRAHGRAPHCAAPGPAGRMPGGTSQTERPSDSVQCKAQDTL